MEEQNELYDRNNDQGELVDKPSVPMNEASYKESYHQDKLQCITVTHGLACCASVG